MREISYQSSDMIMILTMVVSASKVSTTVYGADVPDDGMGMVTWYSAQDTLSLVYGHDPEPPDEAVVEDEESVQTEV